MTKISIDIDVTDKQCADILCTALEGGIGYWCAAGNIQRSSERTGDGIDWDYVSFDAFDEEDDNKPLGRVDYDTIRKGVERILSGVVGVRADIRGGILSDIVNDDVGQRIDAEVADCIVQAGLFNEIVYG